MSDDERKQLANTMLAAYAEFRFLATLPPDVLLDVFEWYSNPTDENLSRFDDANRSWIAYLHEKAESARNPHQAKPEMFVCCKTLLN